MSCYITMPNPCHTGVQRTRDPLTPGEGPRRENTYDNLGNFGSYAEMRKMYLPEHKHRYIYVARSKGGCCDPPRGEHHHNFRSQKNNSQPGLGEKCQPSVRGESCMKGECLNEKGQPVSVGQAGRCMIPAQTLNTSCGKTCQHHHILYQTSLL